MSPLLHTVDQSTPVLTKFSPMDAESDPVESLRMAYLRQSADADEAAERTREMADRLATSLAQLPRHVQFRGRPASEHECAAMQEALPLFEQLAESAGLRERYEGLINRCRLHFDAYRRYLADPNRPASYGDFDLDS